MREEGQFTVHWTWQPTRLRKIIQAWLEPNPVRYQKDGSQWRDFDVELRSENVIITAVPVVSDENPPTTAPERRGLVTLVNIKLSGQFDPEVTYKTEFICQEGFESFVLEMRDHLLARAVWGLGAIPVSKENNEDVTQGGGGTLWIVPIPFDVLNAATYEDIWGYGPRTDIQIDKTEILPGRFEYSIWLDGRGYIGFVELQTKGKDETIIHTRSAKYRNERKLVQELRESSFRRKVQAYMNRLRSDPATEQYFAVDPYKPAEDILFSLEVECSLDKFDHALVPIARHYPEGWVSSEGKKLTVVPQLPEGVWWVKEVALNGDWRREGWSHIQAKAVGDNRLRIEFRDGRQMEDLWLTIGEISLSEFAALIKRQLLELETTGTGTTLVSVPSSQEGNDSVPPCADLEISLRRQGDCYGVELRFSQPRSAADVRHPQEGVASACFDFAALKAQSADATTYGRALSASLFENEEVYTGFSQALSVAQSQGIPFRVRLFVGPDAPELHSLHWETLCNPLDGTALFTGDRVLFSRYMSGSDHTAIQLRPKSGLRTLVVIANPRDSTDYQLASLDVTKELSQIEKADLGNVKELACAGSATLNNIMNHLRDGYDVLYLVAHGTLKDNHPYLFLEDDEGNAAIVSGKALATRIQELSQRPCLVVLASCQSAYTNEAGALTALGPRLAKVGIPAVVAMQDNVTISTNQAFMETFFYELQRDGQIDRTMAVARGRVRNRPDWWMSVLFMRLRDGKLWEAQAKDGVAEGWLPDWDAALDQYREWVKHTYGTMRVLGKHEPVPLEGIYTDVYLLDKPQATRRFDPSQLPQNPDRLKQERVDGLTMVLQPEHQHLVILGRPGAGKTTFLKHIVLQAAGGTLGAIVPLYVALREWNGSDLLAFLVAEVALCGIPDPRTLTEHLLGTGTALLLFDGLDEVNEIGGRRAELITRIERFCKRYTAIQVLVTCRSAATEYQFERFTYVEMADFTDEQITAYTTNWFQDAPGKGAEFRSELGLDEHLGELARTPLLLGMLCLTFEELGHFSQRRADLYREALDVLLSQWDASRNIERGTRESAEVYHTLSLGRKHQLFAHIAYETFEQGETLIPQKRLEQLLTDYLVTVPNAPERIDISPRAVLRAIEAQHGILIESTQRTYTFAHLTFHEYYTALYIAESTTDDDSQPLSKLLWYMTKIPVSHHDLRWRQVILIMVELLQRADSFCQSAMEVINQHVWDDEELTSFLLWGAGKAASVQANTRPVTLRFYYLWLALEAHGWNPADNVRVTARNFAYELAKRSKFDISRSSELQLDRLLSLIFRDVLVAPHCQDHKWAKIRWFSRFHVLVP